MGGNAGIIFELWSFDCFPVYFESEIVDYFSSTKKENLRFRTNYIQNLGAGCSLDRTQIDRLWRKIVSGTWCTDIRDRKIWTILLIFIC